MQTIPSPAFARHPESFGRNPFFRLITRPSAETPSTENPRLDDHPRG